MSETSEVPTISREELKRKTDAGEEFVLVEALPPEAFEAGHLPGARNLPMDRVRERAPELIPDRETEVVVYCADEDCPVSPRVTRILREMGYANAVDYEGGKEDWKEAGYELETGAAPGRTG